MSRASRSELPPHSPRTSDPTIDRRLVSRQAALALLLPIAFAASGHACSICRCGDPTFNALGKDGYAAIGFHLALDWERFEKTEGNPAEESESQIENRYTALVSYGVNDRLTLVARLPFSDRELTTVATGEEPERTTTSGLADPEMYAQFRIWASKFRGDLGRRASLSLNGGLKTPWGENDLKQSGERVDEHAQPGTGSTDLFGSLGYLFLVDADSAFFASAGYRATGENDFAYRYGDVALANLAYEHKLGSAFDGVVELNFRHAERDRADGEPDADTGGEILYLSPHLLASLGHGLVLRAGAQIPVARDLNGFQKERTVANVGVTYLFGS